MKFEAAEHNYMYIVSSNTQVQYLDKLKHISTEKQDTTYFCSLYT